MKKYQIIRKKKVQFLTNAHNNILGITCQKKIKNSRGCVTISVTTNNTIS